MKREEKYVFWLHWHFFLHNRKHFSAAHSHSRLHSFPFLPLLPVSRPHEFSSWRIDVVCCVACVPRECSPSHPQPILLAVSQSWHFVPATASAVAQLGWFHLPPDFPFSVFPVRLRTHHSPLNGYIITHSFQFECFRTSFCRCVYCGSIFSSCVFRKANWNLGYFKTHAFRITLGRWAELFTCPPVGPCHSFSTWMFQIFFPLVSYLVCLLLTSCFCSQPRSHAAFVITRTIGEKPQTWCVSEPGHQIQNELLTCQNRRW